MPKHEIIGALGDFGFGSYESSVMLFLLSQKGPVDAKAIATGSEVPLTKLYSLLLKLERLGLTERVPGKVQLYRAPERSSFLKKLAGLQEQRIRKQRKEAEAAIKLLAVELPKFSAGLPTEAVITYFTDANTYWKVYNKEAKKFRYGDEYRIINNIRLTFGFLREEVEKIPELEEYSEPWYRTGARLHYILNPKALVERTIAELKDEQKIIKSLAQMLRRLYGLRKQIQIDMVPTLKNMLLVVMRECVFLEFYGVSSVTIASAIQIRHPTIVKDFANWFDALCSGKHHPETDYMAFESEVLKWTQRLVKIKPCKIREMI